METESAPDVLIVYQNDFDKSIHDFEEFAREVFNGSNENEKTKLHKKLDEFMTFKEYYKKKHESEKLERILSQSRKRQIVSPVHMNAKKRRLDPLKLFELPNEIWLKIISYLKTSVILKRFNLVCKYFNVLSLDSSAIKYIELRIYDHTELYNQAVSVLKRCKTLNEVYIYNCASMNNLISHTFKSSPRLRKLKLQSLSLSVKAFKNIKIWQGLQSLELIEIDIDNDETLLEVAKIKSLKSLKIKSCRIDESFSKTMITKDIINALAENCNQFEELEIDEIGNEDLLEISKLKVLRSFKFSKGTLNAKQIESLTKCDHFESINFCVSEIDQRILAAALNAFLQKHCQFLKNINLYVAQECKIPILDKISLCDNLEQIDVRFNGICKSDVVTIFQLPSLKKLKLVGSFSFPRELRKRIMIDSLLSNLEEFQGSSDVFSTSNPQIIFQFPKLKRLYLCDDPWVLSKTKRIVLSQMNCPLLERLSLPNFDRQHPFNLDVLRYLMETYPKLKSVQINGHIDELLSHEHLYQLCKETGIFIDIGNVKNLLTGKMVCI